MSSHLPQSTFIPKMDGLLMARRWRTSSGVVHHFMLLAAILFGIYISFKMSFTDSGFEDAINIDEFFLPDGYESVCPGERTGRH
jgi:hypothetical protein